MALTYRLYQEGDLPQLQKLWQGSTEWGSITPALFARHVENAPFGRPIVAVVQSTDDGNIMGQTVLMPSRITVRGRLVTAFRPLAPILARSLRAPSFNPLHHPIFQLHRYALQELDTRGEQLLFMLPDPRWMVLIRMLPDFMHTSFPLWSLPIQQALFKLQSGYTDARLTDPDRRIDKLFDKASEQFACMIVRDAPALFKKAGPPEYDLLGVERSGELVGVVASKAKGDRQWLVCDLLAVDQDAEMATLKAVCNLAHLRASEAAPNMVITKIAILALPRLQASLEKLGFKRDNYDFHLVVKVIGASMSSADVHPSAWYLSAND